MSKNGQSPVLCTRAACRVVKCVRGLGGGLEVVQDGGFSIGWGRTSNGPLDWQAGQEAGLTTSLMFWKKGPSVKLQRMQSYLTCCNCGKTPVRRVTTPVSRTSWFRWNCLRAGQHHGFRLRV